MPLLPIKLFNVGSVPSMQEALFTLAEYVSGTIFVSTINNQQSILQAIQQTLLNMLHLIDGYQIQTLMQQEYVLTDRVIGILPNLSSTDQTLITNRLSSFNYLNQTIYNVPTSLVFDVNQLTNGSPAIQDYDILDYFLTFDAETPPVGFSSSTFEVAAQEMATAWLDALNYVGLNGTSFQFTAYDAIDRMYSCSQDTDNFINNLILAPIFNTASASILTQLWNSLIALPSLLRVAALLYNDPSSQLSQSINVIKVTILNLLFQTNAILSLFIVPNNLQQPVTSALRMGESLLDFAARTTGDFSQWTAIVMANDLVPPYVGLIPMPGIAVPGTKLFLPPFSVNSAISNYTDAYLGTDIYLGNAETDLIWTGDFNIIRGINNYISALQRRVLTNIGSLVYHTNYGSRLPPEVGAVSTANEARLLSSYLKNALLSDPRTQEVNQITAYPIEFGQIVLTALVTPFGSASASSVNLYIIPQSLNTTNS